MAKKLLEAKGIKCDTVKLTKIFPLSDEVINIFVITSYSIHYTKLYEPRGFIGFHSMAYYGVTLIMGTILLDNLIKNHLKEMTWKEKSILLFALFNFITPFFLHFSEILRVPSVLKNKDTKSGYGLIIQELTDENDKIYVTSYNFV